jgi:hypothetical protein
MMHDRKHLVAAEVEKLLTAVKGTGMRFAIDAYCC